jgi:hypothetical protein
VEIHRDRGGYAQTILGDNLKWGIRLLRFNKKGVYQPGRCFLITNPDDHTRRFFAKYVGILIDLQQHLSYQGTVYGQMLSVAMP